MSTHDAAYEASPAGSDNPSQGDERIREVKVDYRIRLGKEHKMYTTGSDGTEAADGWHKAGSAMIYVAASAPTTRPDGSTALSSADDGRLWYDTANAILKYYAHPSWTTVPAVVVANSVTNAGLADMAQATIKGRASGAGTGDPTDLSAAQLGAVLALSALPICKAYMTTSGSDYNFPAMEIGETAILIAIGGSGATKTPTTGTTYDYASILWPTGGGALSGGSGTGLGTNSNINNRGGTSVGLFYVKRTA